MRVLHLAAGNRWTGAAAPAFAEVEALRSAGVEAHYAYVGGYKLEDKLRGFDFAHPAIERAQNPLSFRRTVAALRQLVAVHRFDIIHAHLTWDHWLARFVARGTTLRIVRTFHSQRTLRTDPFTRSLLRRTDTVAVVNDTFRSAPALRERAAHFTPPPVDRRQFKPDGASARHLYGLRSETPVIAVIGKLSPGRGFEDALRTFSEVRQSRPDAALMIIGHGEHRTALEALAGGLGLADSVIWAGYHEDDLAEHYRAANVLLFTAAGSDAGHRAVIEAMACGVSPATYPIDGIHAILGSELTGLIAADAQPSALATTAMRGLSTGLELRSALAVQARSFGYEAAAARLLSAYGAAS